MGRRRAGPSVVKGGGGGGLLDEDEGDDDQVGNVVVDKLTVNEDYARRFEHNKRRDDLSRLRELQKGGGDEAEEDDEDETDEDEDAELLTEDVDERILDTLARLRKKDPTIYRPDVTFFAPENDDDDDDDGKEAEKDMSTAKQKKSKKILLKDIAAQQLLNGDDEDDEDDDGEGGFNRKNHNNNVKTYAAEQEDLKRAFLQGVDGGDNQEDEEEDDLLHVRKAAVDQAQLRANGETTAAINQKLEEYFGHDGDLDEDERFLKGYLLNRGWVDESRDRVPTYDEIVEDEDEEAVERAERFEATYNFRFEEPGGTAIEGHARTVEGSVRKKNVTRKAQRDRKAEREEAERRARREELKRLKNVKKQEIMEKLARIKEVSGLEELNLNPEDLDEEFDPAEHDRKMQAAFGEEYYNAADDEKFDPEAPPPEDDGDDAEEALEGDVDIVERDENGVVAGEDETQTAKQKKRVRQKLRKMWEDLYKLDYEDTVAGMPTRFKYTTVPAKSYGLAPEEILMADDRDLNARISLKRLAPYREDDGRYRRSDGTLTGRRKRREDTQQQQQLEACDEPPEDEPSEAKLTKAQRKNLRRTKKRQQLKGANGAHDNGQGPAVAAENAAVPAERLAAYQLGGQRYGKKPDKKKMKQ
eukprot:jgi/Chlat1/8424/Chrsp80S07838